MTNWITFIGEGRSGHTIVSAILDSHPHVRLAEEQKYITKWTRDGMTREEIIDAAKKCGHGKERKLKALPGSLTWEEPLLAIGDKCGWDAVNLTRKGGQGVDVLDRFSEHMQMPVKVIHTIRNPYDNITCYLDSPKSNRIWKDEHTLYRMCIRRYARFYDAANKLLEVYPRFDLYNEEIIENPERTLTKLCVFLDLPVVEPWLTNAVNSVYKKPNERSKRREWPVEWEEQMPWRIIGKYDFFERYTK
jgi:hypothetical protein